MACWPASVSRALLIGHDELAQTVHHLIEHVGGNDTIAQQFLSPLCPRRCHLFASSHWPCRYGMLVGSDCNNKRLRDATGVKRGDTVGLIMAHFCLDDGVRFR